MTRGGGRGSSRGRGSREPGATRGGWAPLAPPREAPACLGPRPLRAKRARLRRVAAAAAAAMSPGKPGAGGAGTRRTGWRRRRRRRRLEAETRAPGFGHTAGRVPGTFQGAQGMKPAALETRPPPRSPGLLWALLLLLRLGQVSPSGGPGRGVGGRGPDWHPLHLPVCHPLEGGLSGKVLWIAVLGAFFLEGAAGDRPASRSRHRAPSPGAGCQGVGGILVPPPPGCPRGAP